MPFYRVMPIGTEDIGGDERRRIGTRYMVHPVGYYEDVSNLRLAYLPDSRTGESAFSDSIGGAFVGWASGTAFFEATVNVYATNEQPDIDLRRRPSLTSYPHDFHVLGEVRYRRPVPVKLIGRVRFTRADGEEVRRAYEGAYEGRGFARVSALIDKYNRRFRSLTV